MFGKTSLASSLFWCWMLLLC